MRKILTLTQLERDELDKISLKDIDKWESGKLGTDPEKQHLYLAWRKDEAAGMKLSDFFIGCRFYTATGAWICADIGKRCIVAVKESDAIEYFKQDGISDLTPEKISTNADLFKEDVFWWYDFPGCSTEPFSD